MQVLVCRCECRCVLLKKVFLIYSYFWLLSTSWQLAVGRLLWRQQKRLRIISNVCYIMGKKTMIYFSLKQRRCFDSVLRCVSTTLLLSLCLAMKSVSFLSGCLERTTWSLKSLQCWFNVTFRNSLSYRRICNDHWFTHRFLRAATFFFPSQGRLHNKPLITLFIYFSPLGNSSFHSD